MAASSQRSLTLTAIGAGISAGQRPLEAAMLHRRLSREELAVLAGTDVETLRRVEGGEAPGPHLLSTLADALDVPAELLLH
jgi:transcriptional regulator with XRE-family HTH domain